MNDILREQEFYQKLEMYLIEKLKSDKYYFSYIIDFYKDFKVLEGEGLINRNEYFRGIFNDIDLQELAIESAKRYWRDTLRDLKDVGEEFLVFFINLEEFINLNWKSISDRGHWFDYIEFIKELKELKNLLVEKILQNPSFWDISWLEYVKTWLMTCNKNLLLFFDLLHKYACISSASAFLDSPDLLKCPWDICKAKIENRLKEEPSLLSLEEFEDLLRSVQQNNPEIS